MTKKEKLVAWLREFKRLPEQEQIAEIEAWTFSAQEIIKEPLRIRNLPLEEQEPFRAWLTGQTRPWIYGEPMEEQDGYYKTDYARWVKKMPIID